MVADGDAGIRRRSRAHVTAPLHRRRWAGSSAALDAHGRRREAVRTSEAGVGVELGGRRGPARSRAITRPRRCRKLPANAAWRGRASPGSGPRVAHRRRTGQSSHRGARGRHSIRADVHQREEPVAAPQRPADPHRCRLGRALAQPLAGHPLDHARARSPPPPGRRRRRPARAPRPRCSGPPREAHGGRPASRARRSPPRRRTGGGPAAGSPAAPRPRSPRRDRRRPSRPGSGTFGGTRRTRRPPGAPASGGASPPTRGSPIGRGSTAREGRGARARRTSARASLTDREGDGGALLLLPTVGVCVIT